MVQANVLQVDVGRAKRLWVVGKFPLLHVVHHSRGSYVVVSLLLSAHGRFEMLGVIGTKEERERG